MFSPSLVLLQSLLVVSSVLAQSSLESCLESAGVRTIVKTDSHWIAETTPWQARLRANPSAVVYPADTEQLAASIACGREAGVKVNPYGGGHSFAAYGFGNDGNLVVNMEAFQQKTFDPKTNYYTFGGGVRVGPGAKYLWDTQGRHFPHVRSGRVGMVGSSIGGGWGSTSRFLGTPMDNIVSVQYMLYNGTIVNAKRGSDLLWAAQGAGSSFGVIISMTTKTWKPVHPTAVNFTLALGTSDIESGVNGLLAIQEYAIREAPNTLALRWSLATAPEQNWTATGYFYGKPTEFSAKLKPLMSRLPPTARLAHTITDFWTLDTQVAGGLGLPNGGAGGPGRAFYGQALTTTTDNPLTYDSIYELLNGTTFNFNRTDLRKSGLMDLWGGVSNAVSDADTAYAHGNNLWLIRWDANSVNSSAPYPADGISYLRNQMRSFEDYHTSRGIPLRGFVNYRDTALTEAEWSGRLYGEENWEKLLKIKRTFDPEGLFTSNAQSIPVGGNK